MRSWVLEAPGVLRLRTSGLREPRADEVVLRVARAAICGSDLQTYLAAGDASAGVVMGHEAAGVVAATGEDVAGFEIGERVTFAPTVPCTGHCGHSASNRCEELQLFGEMPGVWPGAFAEYVIVPARRVFRLGAVPLDEGAAVEPMAVGLHAARRAGVQAGIDVLVIGGGMIGQAAAQCARLQGAASVTVSDPHVGRRQVAERYGFHTIDPAEVAETARVDCAIDAVGSGAAFETAMRAVRKGGTVCVVGLRSSRVTLTLADLVDHERSIIGAMCYSDEEFADAIAALADGRLDATLMEPVEVGFEQLGDAFGRLADGNWRPIRVVMRGDHTR